jgi:predicted aspartyl protease
MHRLTLRPMRKSILLPALLFLTPSLVIEVEGAAPLTPMDAFVVSHGYGGAQFVRVENTYRVPIKANGKIGDLTIDTGAGNTVIYTASVKKFALQPKLTNEEVRGAFGKGREKVSLVTIPQLTMGNLTLVNVKAGVVSDWSNGGLYRPYGMSDGLLGLREMLRYGMVLDVNNHLLLAHGGGRMATVAEGIRSILSREGYTAVPLSVVDGHLQVSAVVQNTPCKLIVDTGAYFTTLDRDFARDARLGGFDTGRLAHGLGTNARGIGYTHFPQLRVGDFLIRDVSVTLSGLNPEITHGKNAAAGLLGADYLGTHGAVFDFNSSTLYLRPKKG